MKEALEFHDSVVASVTADGQGLLVTFSEAYLHRSTGQPGVSAGEGFVGPAKLFFFGATWSGELAGAIGPISDAWIVIANQPHSLLMLPFETLSSLSAEFSFASGAELRVSAGGATCATAGQARYVEHYPG